MSEQDDVAVVSNTSKFSTRDLNQAAFVWCQPGSELVKLDIDESKIVHFVLQVPLCTSDLTLLIFNYSNEKTQVEPLRFVQNQNKLRDLLYNHKRNEKKKRD